MASVSNVSLALAEGSPTATTSVTVGGTLTFDAGDVGKTYRLEIVLLGEDKSGDKLPAGDPLGDDTLYTFSWGFFPFMKAYKTVTVAAAGSLPFTETRMVTDTKLDEDSGNVQIASPDNGNTPLYMPRKDEVYARATLSGAPVTARSATVTAGIGV